MKSYVVLLRGINVGGKNKIPMAELKTCLEKQGFENVTTYIQSGNVVLCSEFDAINLAKKIETLLVKHFELDSEIVRVLALDQNSYKQVIDEAPNGFGKDLNNYRYDVMFLMGVKMQQAIKQIAAREGIDTVWPGSNVIYYRRPALTSPNATKSYLSKIVKLPLYQSITIRNWNTTSKMLDLLSSC